MDIFKIIGIGFVATVLVTLLKQHKPELAVQMSLIASVLIFFVAAPYFLGVIQTLEGLTDKLNIDVRYFDIVIKVIGVAYVTQFGAELCRDAGESAIASKIELAGKIVLLVMSMPIVYSLVNLVIGLLD